MVDKKEAVISVKNLHKSFKLPHEQHSGIKQTILNIFRRNKVRGYELQQVLKGLDFEIEEGDFFGIVGRNGSGKSTLLKTLASIYTPDKGEVQVKGTLVPFIELGVGFNPELTGRENVFLNGALLGFSHHEMEVMYDDIVAFAELEKFMDQKLKNYSSGMQVRLAFSIAIKAEGDILLLDEVLAVGDEAFQRKCLSYFAELKRRKKTVILVTHSMDSVQRFCTKALMIEKGKIVAIGNPATVAQKYIEANSEAIQQEVITEKKKSKPKPQFVDVKVKCGVNETNNAIEITTQLKQNMTMKDPVVAILLNSESGEQIYRWSSDEKVREGLDLSKDTKINLSLDNIFPVGTFTVGVRVMKKDRTKDYATLFDLASFEITNKSLHRWDVHWKPKEELQIQQEVF